MVSAYFFLNNGKPLVHGSVFNYTKNPVVFLKALKTKMTIVLAKLLPFEIWSLLYTYKKNLSYITNNDDRIIINYICKTENMVEDLAYVFDAIKYNKKHEFQLKRSNSSEHKKADSYFNSEWHKKLFDKKYKKELMFYNSLQNNYHQDLYGKHFSDIKEK